LNRAQQHEPITSTWNHDGLIHAVIIHHDIVVATAADDDDVGEASSLHLQNIHIFFFN
jgi:hypothetical protein